MSISDRLLIGEASSNNQSNESDVQADLPHIRVLDGRDSDDVFLNDTHTLPVNSIQENYFDRLFIINVPF